MLYLGTLEPRKNIKRLILAYSHLVEKNAVTPELVIAGGKGWKYQDIYKTIKEKSREQGKNPGLCRRKRCTGHHGKCDVLCISINV